MSFFQVLQFRYASQVNWKLQVALEVTLNRKQLVLITLQVLPYINCDQNIG